MTSPQWEADTFDAIQQSPEWFGHGADDGAYIEFLSSIESIPETHTDQPALISEANFDTDIIIYVASAGPDANCNQLIVDDVNIAEDELSIEAHVECASGMAAQTITHPATILWVQDIAVDRAKGSIVDGWQQSHAVEAAIDT